VNTEHEALGGVFELPTNMAHSQLSPLAPSASESTPLLSARPSRVEDTSGSPHETGVRDASHDNSHSGEENAASGPRRREIGKVTVAFMIINQMVGTGYVHMCI
jgi:hypothetical protein